MPTIVGWSMGILSDRQLGTNQLKFPHYPPISDGPSVKIIILNLALSTYQASRSRGSLVPRPLPRFHRIESVGYSRGSRLCGNGNNY